MLCIICNKNPEKNWPKRWQCWKENGKFAESICKVLGLPKYPYEDDFKNSLYCSQCQKRVYNMYLTVRKWERILTDISKLKSELEKDFQKSLQKGDTDKEGNLGDMIAAAGEEREKENGDVCLKLTSENETDFNQRMRSFSNRQGKQNEKFVRLNKLRKRILEKMSRPNSFDWQKSSCYDFEIPGGKSQCPCAACHEGSSRNKKGHHLSPEEESQSARSNNENDRGDDASSSYYSSSDEGDGTCDCRDCRNHGSPRPHNSGENMCSSEYCADCDICNKEAAVATANQSAGSPDNPGSASSNHTNSGNETKYVPPSPPKLKKGRQKKEQKALTSPPIVKKSKKKKSDAEQRKNQGSSDEQKKNQGSSDENVKPDVSTLSMKLLELEKSFGPTISMDDIANDEYVERFRCYKSNCTRAFPTKDELEIHVQRHHEGVKNPYKCEQCDKAFQWRRELDAHQLKHTGGVAVCCHLCGRGFRTQRLFGLHLKTKHASERKYKCTQCDKSFISQSKLKTHSTIHTREYPFKCNICGKGFSAKTFLSFHMAKHMEANPYQCATCAKTFSSPRNLQVHQYTHTQTHPFKCTVCQAGAPSETLLKKHMLKHNQEKLNACEICDKKFRFPSSLKKHQKVHEGDKRFHCQYCSKTFIDKYKLTRHERTHSGERPHQCQFCLKSFATKDYLNVHIRIHEKTSSNEITDNYSSPLTDHSLTDEAMHEHGIIPANHHFIPDPDTQNQSHIEQSLQTTEMTTHNVLHDDFLQNSSDVLISSLSHSYFPSTTSSTFPSTSLPENITTAEALVATLEFDNMGVPLLLGDVIDDGEASLSDLNTSSLIVPSYTDTDNSDFLNGEYCSFASFQQL